MAGDIFVLLRWLELPYAAFYFQTFYFVAGADCMDLQCFRYLHGESGIVNELQLHEQVTDIVQKKVRAIRWSRNRCT